jgi:hypothetical protein
MVYFRHVLVSPMDSMDFDWWNSSVSVIYRSIRAICSWTHLDFIFIPNTPPTAWTWPSLRFLLRAWQFQTCFGLSHGSNGLWLVKLISTVFYGSIRAICSWTHLDFTFIPNTPTTAWTWPSLRFLLRAWQFQSLFEAAYSQLDVKLTFHMLYTWFTCVEAYPCCRFLELACVTF